jgi:hypothetical protein
MDVGVSRRNTVYCDRNLLNYLKTAKEKPQNRWYSAENRRVHLLSAVQKQYRSDKRAGIERNSDKSTVIVVSTFVTGGWGQIELQAALSVSISSYQYMTKIT